MLALLASTIMTSAADSLNPFAITQQFVLQGMVKKPKHIWYFIIPTGVVNLIGGFLAYWGLVAVIGDFFIGLLAKYGHIIFRLELALGVLCFLMVARMIRKTRIKARERRSGGEKNTYDNSEEADTAKKIRSVSPLALIALGAGATISELATALPYFAFLTILFNYQLSLGAVSLILVLYNFIYTLPLMILYFIYTKARSKFDTLYAIIKRQINRCAAVVAPTVVALIGAFLVYHSVTQLLA